MLFADLVIPAGVLIILVGVALIAAGIFAGKAGSCQSSSFGPCFDPFAMILMALFLLGGGGLILLGIAKLCLP